jgi:hypothetical protein
MGVNTVRFTSCGRSNPTDDENGASHRKKPAKYPRYQNLLEKLTEEKKLGETWALAR